MTGVNARWHRSISEIPEQRWQELVGEDVIPFYRWGWLDALERSGSIIPDQGWQPLHLAIWRGDSPIAVAPLYLKGHSYGEFVFDQTFARLASDLGLRYYPKLIGMSPVSPVVGYRFHVRSDEDEAALTAEMLRVIDLFCEQNSILSCNFLYVDPDWRSLAEAGGCATWLNQQSLWSRGEDRSFNEYLQRFNANQRRNIKRERKAVAKAGLTVTPLTGEQLDLDLLQTMHRFYQQHCARWGPWGSKYLEEGFFEALAAVHRDQVVLFSAHRGDPRDPVAMSMCVRDDHHLWGRYWGSKEEIDCLHFDVCYYAPIQWAIEQGLDHFDPGAGGSHKRRRGFVALPNASLHRWYHPRMSGLIRAWLPKVNELMEQEIEAINADLPFKAEQPTLAL